MTSTNLTVDWMFKLSQKEESTIMKILKPRPEPQNPQQIQIFLEQMYDTKLNNLPQGSTRMGVLPRARP